MMLLVSLFLSYSRLATASHSGRFVERFFSASVFAKPSFSVHRV